jgi:hypothetical protein
MMDLKRWNGFVCPEGMKLVADVRGVSERLEAREIALKDLKVSGMF